ncbi:hypothetical protein LCGC14_0924020 [marine sediment metagenome]|uniref:Uncharacterized protein n=1 Tax=marine sediment metagenome TaxID=412755 RepID=A0A0F9NPY3_9ZZZZ
MLMIVIGHIGNDKVLLESDHQKNIHTAAQVYESKQWIKNPTFESPIEPTWFWKNGTDGDNSDVNATSSSGQANFEVLGETKTFTVVSGVINSSTSTGWKQFNKTGFLLPDSAGIAQYGGFVSHSWNDDPNQFPSVQWKKNISMPIDMSDYTITSASINVIVNATVSNDVDTPNDSAYWENFAIGDSVTFYSQISDLSYDPPIYTVASNRTKYLGQNSPSILTLADSKLDQVSEADLITALNFAFEKDSSHSNFTLTLGIDIYSEDNLGSADPDNFDELIIKTCNLTFTVKRKIDQSTTVSWNQICNKITGASIQIVDANFNFKYKVDKTWPSSAPLSELRFSINNKSYDAGIIKLSSANLSFQEAIIGGFDVTDLITANVNISVSLELFLKDAFDLEDVYTISIDEVYLNISYINTFPDYGSEMELFLDGVNKTSDPIIQIPYFDVLNITITYKDNNLGNHLLNSTVFVEGKISGNLIEHPIFEQYYVLVNASDLGLGASILTITAQKENYETVSIQIFVEVFEQPTKIQLVIDNIDRSVNETIDARFNELLNVTIFYKNNLTDTHISGASLSLLGTGKFNETGNHYNVSLNTNNLKQGINILTIFAQLENFQSQTIQFFINVIEIATELLVFLEGNQTFMSNVVSSQKNEILNITAYYQTNNSKEHINGASVELLGFESFSELNNQFNFSLNTNSLVQGINVLTIFAQINNYQAQTFQFFINIEERATTLQLFVDTIQKIPSDTINTQFDEILNITVLYRDENTNTHINGANVELLGIGFLNESSKQYNISLATNSLEKGINILTIFAQLNGFQHKTFQIFIDVDDRNVELLLYVNGFQLNDSETVQVEIDENLNITTILTDKILGSYLSGASIELLGIGTLNETLNQYNITIGSNDLELGINIINIFAQLNNYQPSSIQFFIEVVKKATNIVVHLDGIDKTNDPVLTLPITSQLNLTIKYLHNQSGIEISGANIQIIGEGLTEFLIWDVNFLQYSYILNTTNFGIGIKLFTIVAQAPNYQINTVDIRLTVNRINTEISIVSGELIVDIISKSDYQIQVVLNNTDFGGIIKNATVTYLWDRGSGELTDADYDGIYEVILRNIPAGSFIITITAYVGEEFEFKTFEIFINAGVKPEFDFTIVIILLLFGIVGIGTYFVLYQKYFKYPQKVRKIRSLRKSISKNKKLKPISIQTREDIIQRNIDKNKQLWEIDKPNQNTLKKIENSKFLGKVEGDNVE